MKRIFIAISLVTLLPAISPAQENPSPAGVWCFVCQPKNRVSGPVRTLLSSVRRGEKYFGTTALTYDSQGRVIDRLTYFFGDIYSGANYLVDTGTAYLYTYDPKGKLLKESMYYTGNQNMVSFTQYIYDAKGRLSEEAEYLSNGTPLMKTTFTYEPGSETVTAITNSYTDGRANKPFKAVLTYSSKGQWVRRATYAGIDGLPSGIKEFSYNENGDIAKVSSYEATGKYLYADVFTYKYDSHGNWYERHDMETNVGEDGKVTEKPDWEITYRVITYQ